MKKIIIPTDFSITALNAAFYAFELFDKETTEFYLVNVYQIPYTMPEVIPIGGELAQQQLKVAMDKEVEKIKKITKYAKLNLTGIVKFGYAGVVINELSEDLKVEAIVMGTTGASGVKEIVFGSTANDIATSVKCPTWIIPRKIELSLPKNILFATDFKAVKDKNILKPLIEIAKENDSFVQIINTYGTDKDGIVEKDGIEFFNILRDNNIKHAYHLTFESHSVEKNLLDYINKNETDLLVLIKRDYGFLKNIFHHSITKELTFHSTVPILILHDVE